MIQQVNIFFTSNERYRASANSALFSVVDNSPAAPITINRPKIKRTNPRLSFPGPEPNDNPTEEEEETPFVVKKSALSRKAIERAAAARIGSRVVSLPKLPSTTTQVPSNKTYSKEYLDELRSSTPSTPLAAVLKDGEEMDIDVLDDSNDISREDPLGTISKFGTSAAPLSTLTTSSTTNIPDESLVRVLKARREERARKSKEKGRGKDFISFSGDNSQGSNEDGEDENNEDGYGNLRLRTSKKKKESRLQRVDLFDDDDAELQQYVQDDEKLILANSKYSRRKAQDEQRRRKQGMIQEALDFAAEEDGDDDFTTAHGADRDMNDFSDKSSDDDDHDVRNGWERDQIRAGAGLYALGSGGPTDLESRLHYQPPNIPPIPTLSDSLSRLETMLKELELIRDQTVKRVEGVRWEKVEIEKREIEVQEGLRKAGEEYARLGLAGLSMENPRSGGEESGRSITPLSSVGVGAPRFDRGLESIGNTPTRTPVAQ